jgi:hypothetical protein
MIWIIILAVFVVSSFITLLAGNFHGYTGAVILGLDAILADLFLQWLRFKMVAKGKTSHLVVGILCGLAARVASIFLFIEVGLWWLGKNSNYFLTFAVCLLTIPLWSLIAAYQFKLERK